MRIASSESLLSSADVCISQKLAEERAASAVGQQRFRTSPFRAPHLGETLLVASAYPRSSTVRNGNSSGHFLPCASNRMVQRTKLHHPISGSRENQNVGPIDIGLPRLLIGASHRAVDARWSPSHGNSVLGAEAPCQRGGTVTIGDFWPSSRRQLQRGHAIDKASECAARSSVAHTEAPRGHKLRPV